MDYVYCVVFSDNTAKFGRSTDVWNRICSLDAEGKRFGRTPSACFVSTVFDGVRAERDVLRAAEDMLTQTSKESFIINGASCVARVLEAARIPYIFCHMMKDRFGMELSSNSFSTNFDLVIVDRHSHKEKGRKGRLKARILKVVSGYNGNVTKSILSNKIPTYNSELMDEVLLEMIEDGSLVREENLLSRCGWSYKTP